MSPVQRSRDAAARRRGRRRGDRSVIGVDIAFRIKSYVSDNIWPRPYQPTPPVWMTGLSVETGRMAAERGHVVGTLRLRRSEPRQFAVTIASAVGGYPIAVKAEPNEETKESGIIFGSTGRGAAPE